MISLHHLKNKTVGVFGLSRTGKGAVAALLAGGARVFAWDDSFSSSSQEGEETIAPFASWPWAELSCVVLSPGVPLTHPAPHAVVEMAKAQGVEVIGDIELLWRECPDATYVGITGTNGKSTTTALIGHVLQSAGRKVQIGGNLGTAALTLEPLGAGGVYVLETSSYQLDLLARMRFNVAVWLNITPDHIDRHGDIDGYVKAKAHIFANQRAQDTAVIGVDDRYSQSQIARCESRVVQISTRRVLPDGLSIVDGILHDAGLRIDLRNINSLTGRHNWQNAVAAYAACRALGLAPAEIEAGMRSFPGLPHRMEQVAVVNGVRFVNDSKGTNADATANALAAYDRIYWILGGKPKEGGIESLAEYFPKIAHAFLIGQAAESFARALEGRVPYTQCGTLARAFEAAAGMAVKESVVLLSPACASWDQWKSFEERGDAFRAMAHRLEHEHAV